MSAKYSSGREFAAKITKAAREAVWTTDSERDYRRAVWQAMGRIRTRGPIRYATKRRITKMVIDRVWNEPDPEHLDSGQAMFLRSLREDGPHSGL